MVEHPLPKQDHVREAYRYTGGNATTESLAHAIRWHRDGIAVALATVIVTRFSSPGPVGSRLAVNASRDFAGSVAGGCVEGAVVGQAIKTLREGTPRVISFTAGDDETQGASLSCGGAIEVLIEPVTAAMVPLIESLLAAQVARQPVALVTHIGDGRHCLLGAGAVEGDLVLTHAALAAAKALLACGESAMLPSDVGGFEAIFVQSQMPSYRLLIIGAVHIAQALVPMAALAGFAVTVIDPRTAFATDERFPAVSLVTEWPDQALSRIAPDSKTAIVTLTHDRKFDDPALAAALGTNAFYIGALGSTSTHAERLERLRGLGFVDHDLARIHGPVGLPLGGRTPAEIAVAVLAHIIKIRYLSPVC